MRRLKLALIAATLLELGISGSALAQTKEPPEERRWIFFPPLNADFQH